MTPVLVDGGVEGLSKDDSFFAQHILTPLTGAAIHINAFNFPCWGMLEKLAPTLLAGMPAIVKPASQTAYLTELMFRRILEAGVLPEGALQLICGCRRRSDQSRRRARTSSPSPAPPIPAAGCAAHPAIVGEFRALQHGGRQPQRRDPGRRRGAGLAGVRSVRQGSRARDDGEGRAEMHRDPPRARTARAVRGGRRGDGDRLAKTTVGDPAR